MLSLIVKSQFGSFKFYAEKGPLYLRTICTEDEKIAASLGVIDEASLNALVSNQELSKWVRNQIF
jgi:hypothetical protein